MTANIRLDAPLPSTSSGWSNPTLNVELSGFPTEEHRVLELWKHLDAFQTSVRMSKEENRPIFTFYDGPPFATGLPHYGHILAGTIKDVVTRYAHQTGHHVERRFGWDCHGVPIEFEIEKDLGIKSKEDVEKMGIQAYNAKCRSIVMKFAAQWEEIVTRAGRWIDFERDYKTMNLSYMESVWWVFKTLWEKKLVYRGFKVMPYSTSCTTPLSNFEANMNYKTVSDPSVLVLFPLVNDATTSFVAWTTTPWTLPSNLLLCVNPEFDYVTVIDKTKSTADRPVRYILAECRLSEVFKPKKGENPGDLYEIVSKAKGNDLAGSEYVPLFDYFETRRERGAFRVVSDSYVTSDTGTGVVHCAPGFGEDDFRVCVEKGAISSREGDAVCPIDCNGRLTKEVRDFEGMYIKDADNLIIDAIKAKGRLLSKGAIAHSYPFCWRSESPLIYRTISSWFVDVCQIKDQLLERSTESYWVPEFVQTKRFHNWLADARDWAVSRTRYWGTPLPIWTNETFSEYVVVGSVAELAALSGVTVDDLHRESIDHIEIPSPSDPTGPPLRRVPDVFDCWFESGSMPYAQLHYPFENKEKFHEGFPADFIAEGLDQTRGWFYTLLVLSTALFNSSPFKNLVANGLVLAEDGKKMSKKMKNYPDPVEIMETAGADALRLYLINSPAVRAEPLRFKKEGVSEVVRSVIIPLYNAFKLFAYNYNRSLKAAKETGIPLDDAARNVYFDVANYWRRSTNTMDKWISSCKVTLLEHVKKEMEHYKLYAVVPGILAFLENLTKWYLRMNRQRLKGLTDGGEEEAKCALSTTFDVLLAVCVTCAPFIPFITEKIYQSLRLLLPDGHKLKKDSVHFVMISDLMTEGDLHDVQDPVMERRMNRMQAVIDLARMVREKPPRTPLKCPLREVFVVQKEDEYRNDLEAMRSYLELEVNTTRLVITPNEEQWVSLSFEPVRASLGKKFRKDASTIASAVLKLTHQQVADAISSNSLEVEGFPLSLEEDVAVVRNFKLDQTSSQATTTSEGEKPPVYDARSDGSVVVVLDKAMDVGVIRKRVAREFVSAIQQTRKRAGLHMEDEVDIYWSVVRNDLSDTAATGEEDEFSLDVVVETEKDFITQSYRMPILPAATSLDASREKEVFFTREVELFGETIKLMLLKTSK